MIYISLHDIKKEETPSLWRNQNKGYNPHDPAVKSVHWARAPWVPQAGMTAGLSLCPWMTQCQRPKLRPELQVRFLRVFLSCFLLLKWLYQWVMPDNYEKMTSNHLASLSDPCQPLNFSQFTGVHRVNLCLCLRLSLLFGCCCC